MRELERDPTDIHAPTRALPPIAVIGRGRMGGSLGSAAAVAGLDVRQAGREKFDDACAEAEAVLLCVPDAEIEAACERAAEHVGTGLRLVGHTSGATQLHALRSATAVGADVFSLHPLQTVPDDRTSLAGAPAAVAGSSAEAVAFAHDLAVALGMTPFEVDDSIRATYHAAAAIASNFLVTLEESAAALLAAAGVEHGRELLSPLVLRTAANWSERGGAALTGPIARGDRETVDRHIAALREHAPEMVALYETLAERTRTLAVAAETGDEEE